MKKSVGKEVQRLKRADIRILDPSNLIVLHPANQLHSLFLILKKCSESHHQRKSFSFLLSE